MKAKRMVWLFRPDAMQPGDVVLERGVSPKASLVASATRGRFSHALLWVGRDFIEAMPEGVRSLSFARVPIVEPPKWKLLRPLPEHVQHARDAAIQARGMAFKEYDTQGALRTVFGPRRSPVPTRRFCSQLIVESYSRAGLDLLPGKRPEAVTPNMLAGSPYLEAVELPLMSSEEVQRGPYPPDFLDRSKAYLASGMHREAEINRALFRVAEAKLKGCTPSKGVLNSPGNLGEVLDYIMYLDRADSFPVADALLSEMDKLGYFSLLVPQMAELSQRVTNTPRWKEQIPGWEQSRQRHAENQSQCLSRFTSMPHPIWTSLTAMYALNARAFEVLIAKANT